MKVRTGFISNSSTACFICGAWGTNKYNISEATDILQKILNFYNDLEEQDLYFEGVFRTPAIATEKDIDHLSDYDVSRSKVEGKMLIMGAEDNSIPYMLFELINEKFSAERVHLG